MDLNIERWLRTRVLRLPARWNSYDDVMAHPGAKALLRRGFEALTKEIRRVFEQAPAPVHQVKGWVWEAIERNLDLDELRPEERELVRKRIDKIFAVDDELVEIEAALIAELRRALKL